MGYMQAGSVISLYAGLIAGSIAIIGGVLVRREARVDLGLKILLGVAVVLAVVFAKRIKDTGAKFMPAGFMILNAAGLIILCALALKERSELKSVVEATRAPARASKKLN